MHLGEFCPQCNAPYGEPVTAQSAGRRAANKARTREAIVAAVHRLVSTQGLATLTAERVADAAGISRRTFFNYFPSIEAVMAYRARLVMDRFGAMLSARPGDEALAESLKTVVDELFTIDLLTEAAGAWRAVESSPTATRYALAEHEGYLTDLVAEWTRTRLSDDDRDDPLRVEVTLAACMATFEVARRHWMAAHTGPVDRRARDDFVAIVHRTFDVLWPPEAAGRGSHTR
jgi:AcrR family transcriptional regulator